MRRPVVLGLLGSCLLVAPRLGRADEASTTGYFPLRVGNWWTYEEQDGEGANHRETPREGDWWRHAIRDPR